MACSHPNSSRRGSAVRPAVPTREYKFRRGPCQRTQPSGRAQVGPLENPRAQLHEAGEEEDPPWPGAPQDGHEERRDHETHRDPGHGQGECEQQDVPPQHHRELAPLDEHSSLREAASRRLAGAAAEARVDVHEVWLSNFGRTLPDRADQHAA